MLLCEHFSHLLMKVRLAAGIKMIGEAIREIFTEANNYLA